MKVALIFFFVLFCFSGKSKTWQVSNVNTGVDFPNLSLANARAENGDTIFVEGTGNPYDGVTITKKLILIGPGYFLSENPETHFNKQPAVIKTNIVFETGSSGSKIMGFDLAEHNANILIKESEIIIARNRLNDIYFYHYNLPATYNDVVIKQNYIQNNIGDIWNHNSTLVLNRLIISNNYINSISLDIVRDNSAMSALIENNIVADYLLCFNSIVRNNIYLQKSTYYSSYYYIFEKKRFNDVYNNILIIGSPTDLVNYQLGNNNQFLINRTTLFVDFTGSTDNQWKLRENSSGSGKGSDGTDIGMFGGAAPYQLSGLPPLPVIYEIIGPDVETGKVTVKAKAIK